MSKVIFADATPEARRSYRDEWVREDPQHRRSASNFAQGMGYLRQGFDVFFDIEGLTEHEIVVVDTAGIQRELGEKLVAEINRPIQVGDKVWVRMPDGKLCYEALFHPHGAHEVIAVKNGMAQFRSGDQYAVEILEHAE